MATKKAKERKVTCRCTRCGRIAVDYRPDVFSGLVSHCCRAPVLHQDGPAYRRLERLAGRV